jgi:hypothetical protein
MALEGVSSYLSEQSVESAFDPHKEKSIGLGIKIECQIYLEQCIIKVLQEWKPMNHFSRSTS